MGRAGSCGEVVRATGGGGRTMIGRGRHEVPGYWATDSASPPHRAFKREGPVRES
jgi:hypothetical protein